MTDIWQQLEQMETGKQVESRQQKEKDAGWEELSKLAASGRSASGRSGIRPGEEAPALTSERFKQAGRELRDKIINPITDEFIDLYGKAKQIFTQPQPLLESVSGIAPIWVPPPGSQMVYGEDMNPTGQLMTPSGQVIDIPSQSAARRQALLETIGAAATARGRGVVPKTQPAVTAVKERGWENTRRLVNEFHSPEEVLAKDPIAKELWEGSVKVDMAKTKFLHKRANQMHEAFQGIAEGSQADLNIMKLLDEEPNGPTFRALYSTLSQKEKDAYHFLRKDYKFLMEQFVQSRSADAAEYKQIMRLGQKYLGKGKTVQEVMAAEGFSPSSPAAQEALEVSLRKIKNYAPHMFDRQDLIRASQAELEQALKAGNASRALAARANLAKLNSGAPIDYEDIPARIRFKFFEKRRGAVGFNPSAQKAYRSYLAGISKKIYDEPWLRMADAKISLITDEPTREYLLWYARRFKGLEASKLQDLSNTISSLNWARTLGLNPRSAIVNLTQRLNTIVDAGPINSLRGYVRSFSPDVKRAFDASGIANEVPQVLFEGYSPGLEKLRSTLGFLFNKVELGNRKHAFATYFDMARREGALVRDATQAGIKGVHKTQFLYGRTGMPKVFSNPVGRLAFQFWSFPIKQLELMHHWAKEEPLKLVQFLAMGEGGNQALQHFAGLDLSNALGFGIDYDGAVMALQGLSKGQLYTVAEGMKLMVSKGTGILPSGLSPTAQTAVNLVTKPLKSIEDVFDIVKAPDWVERGMRAASYTVEGKRLAQAYKAYLGRHEGQYPIFTPDGELVYEATGRELVARTAIATPTAERTSRKVQATADVRKDVRMRVSTLLVKGETEAAAKLLEKYDLPLPTWMSLMNAGMKHEIDRQTRQEMKRGKDPWLEYMNEETGW